MLIDAFTYFNEKELVELRIKYLNPIVDYFVVVESNITFTGKEKKWNFPEVLKSNLKDFSNKIQYHQLNIKIDEIKSLIMEAMPDAEVSIDDLAGDDNHYSATIKSKIFSGKSKIEQHKLVYKALKGKMGNELHALEINTVEI